MSRRQPDPTLALGVMIQAVLDTGAQVARIETSPDQYTLLAWAWGRDGRTQGQIPTDPLTLHGVPIISTTKKLPTTYVLILKRERPKVDTWA